MQVGKEETKEMVYPKRWLMQELGCQLYQKEGAREAHPTPRAGSKGFWEGRLVTVTLEEK